MRTNAAFLNSSQKGWVNVIGAVSTAALLTATVPRVALCQGNSWVVGRVVDSLSSSGLAGALVQLLAADDRAKLVKTTVSDSVGYYTLRGLIAGTYVLGFAHPLLDSLGIDVPLREIRIGDSDSVTIDLATPSSSTLIGAVCGPTEQGAAVMGKVRTVGGASAAGANVTVEWTEFSFGGRGIARDIKRVDARMQADGWYSACSLPTAGAVTLAATHQGNATGRIEVDIPKTGLIRQDLYVGRPNRAVGDDAPTEQATRAYAAKLTGIVRTASGQRPIMGARVTIGDGPSTVTRADGGWSLTDSPTGTQVLEVRAIGYYPKRETVNVSSESKFITVELPTLKSILDTIRVTARMSSDLADFDKRRRIGNGRFLTPADIRRFPATITSDLFRTIPGVRLTLKDGQRFFQFRGTFEPWCSPGIFVNGHNMSFMNADDLDDYVPPERVAGIEVYTGAFIPPQFQAGLAGCGSIVVWTR